MCMYIFGGTGTHARTHARAIQCSYRPPVACGSAGIGVSLLARVCGFVCEDLFYILID